MLAAFACTTDLDCSLNGLCVSGRCQCDTPWIGERCGLLDLRPGEAGMHDVPLCAYHGDGPNFTSWGGSVVFDDTDGRYHLPVLPRARSACRRSSVGRAS